MRLSIASTSVAAILALSAGKVAAQVAGDPVTYTTGGVVYTAVLDPDLDTVSDRPYSTVAAGGALGGQVVTTVDANGNPITISNGVTLGAAATTSPVRTTALRTTAAAVGGGVSTSDDDNTNGESNVDVNSNNEQDDQQSPPKQLHFQQFDRRALHSASPDQPRLQRRQAALGGGGGQITSQTGLQTISGYDPPANTAVPEPTNFGTGTILQPSQIPGYTGKENSQGISGGGVSGGGVSSDGVKLNIGKLALASTAGAIVFALL